VPVDPPSQLPSFFGLRTRIRRDPHFRLLSEERNAFLVHIHADIFSADHKGVPPLERLRQALKPYSTRGALLYCVRFTDKCRNRLQVRFHMEGYVVYQPISSDRGTAGAVSGDRKQTTYALFPGCLLLCKFTESDWHLLEAQSRTGFRHIIH
jgi:hypothetical protein